MLDDVGVLPGQRESTRRPPPPMTIGGPPGVTGSGVPRGLGDLVVLALKVALPSRHSARMIARLSARRATRTDGLSIGMPDCS